MRRKSTARGSAENVRTLLGELGYSLGRRDLHINFPGGAPVDGPSAGAAMAVAAISALTGTPVDGTAAVTGEISVQGRILPVGGVPAKVEAASRAGLTRVYIPRENGAESLRVPGIEVICVSTLEELLPKLLRPAAGKEEREASHVPEPLPVAAQGTATNLP